MLQKVLEADEIQLAFDVGILGEMTTSLGILCTKGRLNCETVSQDRKLSFEVKLCGLG
jgi:hypothetical protein